MKRALPIALVVVGLVLIVALGYWNRREPEPRRPRPGARSWRDGADDPRLSFATPYRNVRPEVRYVGDAACAECHADLAASYQQHSMGRSLVELPESSPPESLAEAAGNPFVADEGYRYSVSRRQGRTFHKEEKLDAEGNVLFETEEEVHFAVGAGGRGRSYLINRDGRLYMSPITWYPQKEHWALSPGYEVRNQHFTRPIVPECLYCHANFAHHVEHTINGYREPIFDGPAIGCERCHGPGELHVERHQGGRAYTGMDDTIVNPARLEPVLREAVCQQCHLGGEMRVARRGRDLYDYRPGLPLHLFTAVFTARAKGEEAKITGHVEQMHASRCYEASQGKLGCISCHDPHRLPEPVEKAGFYRTRCLSCHEPASCSADEASRQAVVPADSCIVCHMPAIGSEVQHAAITDHRIPRVADRPEPAEESSEVPATGVALFHRELVDPGEAEALRDLGIAIMRLSDQQSERISPADQRYATGVLEAAVARHPDDLEAAEALGHAWWSQGRHEASLELFERIVRQVPRREFSLYSAAARAQQLQRYETAIDYWRRAIEVNPWVQQQHQGLAQSLGEQRRWREAAEACRRALELFPGDLRSRQLLVECYLGMGETEAAEAEFERLLRFDPLRAEKLKRWFAEHPARR